MKNILIILFLGTSLSLISQENWFTDMNNATEYAASKNVGVLMVFAGSDWCKPCINFKQKILLSAEFKTYAEENLAVLYLDFPAKKKNKLSQEQQAHNDGLAEHYNSEGIFPKILIQNSEGTFKNIDEFSSTPSAFIKAIKNEL